MKQLTVLLCGVLVVGVIGAAKGENWCSHRIIIVVQKSNEIDVKGTNVPLSAGSAFSKLQWKTDQSPKKITVSTNLTSAKSMLHVRAVNCLGGISAGRVPLIVSGQDFVTSISNLAGMCMLKYSVGAGTDKNNEIKVHTVFYTITDAD